ncbi:MAG: hypothetical protein FWF03_01820 [Defluviitaleaceae bacterium]|nr:hypothetical protein [Defluviitaleaceae bacterium]
MFKLTESKGWIYLFKAFSVFCVVAAVVCLICDLAINKGLTWSLFTVCSVAFAWASAAPALLMRTNRCAKSLIAFTALTVPYLYALTLIGKWDWFAALALPLCVTWIAASWAAYCSVRYKKMNRWHKAAAITAIITIGYVATTVFVNLRLSGRLFEISDIISIISCAALSVILFLAGAGKLPKKSVEGEGEIKKDAGNEG